MNINATEEINNRYVDYKKNNSSSVIVPSFEDVPLLGENIDKYMEYISNNSILNAEPTNAIGKFMRKLNFFWFRPILFNQDELNKAFGNACKDFYDVNSEKRLLLEKLSTLERKVEELEKRV